MPMHDSKKCEQKFIDQGRSSSEAKRMCAEQGQTKGKGQKQSGLQRKDAGEREDLEREDLE